ncbi:MAG: hypothetical protein RSP_24320 [Rhodanobacter sp.]
MVETQPSVALLFDDAELGAQLRQVLQECGARIVHEGGVAGFDAATLHRHDPDVLVVNLDDEDDEAFDRLFGMVDGDRPRLVLNDARASRDLSGWDRARWARHFAVKVLANGDIDPPRPADAQAVVPATVAVPVEPPVPEPVAAYEPAATALPDTDDAPGLHADATADDLEAELAALLAEPQPSTPAAETVEMPALDPELESLIAGMPTPHEEVDALASRDHAATDNLEAELAAMLADDNLLPDEQPVHAAPSQDVPMHDGDFSLASQDDAWQDAPAATPASAGEPRAPAVPDGWALVEHDASASAPAKAADFGIEKLSAADFLAPDVEPTAEDFKPTLSLELLSMEEAVAPQAWEPAEMLLDDLDSALSRVVALGAAADGLASVCEFLAELPVGARHTILLTQHYGAESVETVLERLSAHSVLPVRLAMQGSRARSGEVLLVPADGQVQLRRDGKVEVHPAQSPSIDASFSMAASAFPRDAVGIVFAGRSTDAVAGAQAIHDRGGQVWVEAADGAHHDDMVGGVFAERLVSYSGTPRELAAHLIEVYP